MFGLVPMMMKNNDLTAKEDMFDRFFSVFDEPFLSGFKNVPEFKVDVKDIGNAYELSAELPGLKKENISLKYENNYLTISTKKEDTLEEKDENGSYVRRERATNSMSRSFFIKDIDEKKCSAEYKDGVLTINMPKIEEQEKTGHTIEIAS
ncbi:MAG: Hsp20/alpha crystallin family protein [Selenomonadaceae bacterium]|nr:Hsp20/alpha crystallin family protein [Selenomonadaceae bacterium]